MVPPEHHSQPTSAPRLGFLELQAGTRGGPRRVVFAVPALEGVQRPLFELLRGRELLGLCMDRAHGSESPAALSTRFWRRNGTVALPLLAAGSTRESWPPVEQQRLQAREREKADARVVAQSLLLTLHEDGDGAVNPLDPQLPTPQEEVDSAQSRRALTSGLMLARHDWDPAQRHVAVAEVVQGHDVLKDMHDAAQRKRKSGSCSVRIVESGELLVPDEPEEPSEASSPLPLLPSLDGDANVERVVLPLGRPVASLHRHLQLTSSEPREVYHYQVATAGLPRGQKVLLGALSHDSGQPVLLLSYSSASAGFQEAHWALPVECGVEICSYQVRQQQPARLPDRAFRHVSLIARCPRLHEIALTGAAHAFHPSLAPRSSPRPLVSLLAAPHRRQRPRLTASAVAAERRAAPVGRSLPLRGALATHLGDAAAAKRKPHRAGARG